MALFKKVSAATLALLLSASAVSASAAGVQLSSRYGDADNNMSINTQDFTAMASVIVSNTAGEIYDSNGIYKTALGVYNVDFNFDGKLNVDDMVFLKKMLKGEKLSQLANPYDDFTAMVSNLTAANEIVVKSYAESDVAGVTSSTKATVNVKNGVAEINADSDKNGTTVSQNVIADRNNKKLYTKNNGEWKVEDKEISKSSVLTLALEMIKNAQTNGTTAVPSLNAVEILSQVSEKSFANAYSYENPSTGAKYIALPLEDVATSVAGAAGTYIIEMDSNNVAQAVRIVIGTAGNITENGIATFTYAADDVKIPDIKPVTPPDDGDPGRTEVKEEEKPYDVLIKAVKALKAEEHSIITGSTEETLVNGDVKYSNKAKFEATRDGDKIDGELTDGEFIFDGDKYSYVADLYADITGSTSADVYVKPTVYATIDGKPEVLNNTGWLMQKVAKGNFGGLKSDLMSAGRTVYQNALSKLAAEEEAKAADAKAKADKFEADVKALQNDIDAYKVKIDNAKPEEKDALEAEKASLETRKAELEKEKNDLLDLKAEFEAKKAKYEEAQANFKKEMKDQIDFVLPTRSELKEMFKGENSTVKDRVNSNGNFFNPNKADGTPDESTIILVIKSDAAKSDKYVASTTGSVEFTLDAKTYKPSKIEFVDASATATEINNGAVATVVKTEIDFSYPSTTTVDTKVTESKDALEYVKTNSDFTDFVAKVAASKIKID